VIIEFQQEIMDEWRGGGGRGGGGGGIGGGGTRIQCCSSEGEQRKGRQAEEKEIKGGVGRGGRRREKGEAK
jgi:hypothetical protein